MVYDPPLGYGGGTRKTRSVGCNRR